MTPPSACIHNQTIELIVPKILKFARPLWIAKEKGLKEMDK